MPETVRQLLNQLGFASGDHDADVRMALKELRERRPAAPCSIERTGELYHADPDCEHVVVAMVARSGVRCTKCSGWYCS